MKKLNLFTFLLALFFTFNLSAQEKWDFGLRTAHNIGVVSSSSIYSSPDGVGGQVLSGNSILAGTSFGVVARRNNWRNRIDWEFEAGGIYNWRKLSNNTVSSYHSTAFYFNAAPKIKLAEKWYVSTGLEGRYIFADTGVNNWNLSASLGLEYRLNDRWSFFVQYNKALTPTSRQIWDNTQHHGYNDRGLVIGVTYYFKRKK